MSEKTNAPKEKTEAAPAPGGRHRGAASMSQVMGSMDSLKRVVKLYVKQFPVLTWIVVVCIIYNSIAAALPSVFLQKVIAVIEETYEAGDWTSAKIRIVSRTGKRVATSSTILVRRSGTCPTTATPRCRI